MKKLKNIHPGEILSEEFLFSMGISAYRLSKETFIPQTRTSEIIKGNRRITADTTLRFARYFGTEFEEAYKLFFDQIEVNLMQNETLRSRAKANKIDTFKYAFDDQFPNQRMDQNQDISFPTLPLSSGLYNFG